MVSSWISPDSHFACTVLIPFFPSSLVFPPNQIAFSLADSKISSEFMSAKGILCLSICCPSSSGGCCPSSLPSSKPRQQALALQVTLVLSSASSRPQPLRNLAQLSLPPFPMRSNSSGLHSSRLTLLILVIQEISRQAAAQSRQRKMAWERSAHCLLDLPQFRHRVLGSCWNIFSNLAAGPLASSYIAILSLNYSHPKTGEQMRAIIMSRFVGQEGNRHIQDRLNIIQICSMNLKIDRLLPYPPSTTQPHLLVYVSTPIPALLLYAPPKPADKPEEPKKKFAFKANTQTVNTVEPVHLFDLQNKQWMTHQTKGKFPSRRELAAKACLGPCLLLYGGSQLIPAKQLNDLFCLNLNTWQWKKLFTMEAPPASPRPLALSTQDKFILITSQVWVFNAKGVNWQAQSSDLPGGVWEKVQGCGLPFKPLTACFNHQQILIFGSDSELQAASLNIGQKQVTQLAFQGQMKGKAESLQVCITSQGTGLLVDGLLFCSFVVHQDTLFITEREQSSEFFRNLVMVETGTRKINFGITDRKQLASAYILVSVQAEEAAVQEEGYYEQGEQQPDTTRHLIRDDLSHRSSIIQREEEVTSKPLPSPLSIQGRDNPYITRLSPLLAREWLKRRLLEEKSKLLEGTIKKAERMVLSLRRYGEQEQKQAHIGKVCRIRQSLCKVLQSESFIKKQMAERPGERELRTRAVQQEHGPSFFDPNQI